MYTLSEVSKRTGISMPTLQRYKKMYQGRIPASGVGRKQRYPEDALPVFQQIKQENAGRRGRPRKSASAAAPARGVRRRAGARRGPGRPPGRRTAVRRGPGRPPGRRGPGRPPGRPAGAVRRGPGRPPGRRTGDSNLLTLTEISKRTAISYPTLVRYVRLYSNRLPHVGTGRARRFRPEAVEVFRELRAQSGRGGRRRGPGRPPGRRPGRPPGRPPGRRGPGRPPGSTVGGVAARRLRDLERAQAALERQMKRLVRGLQKLVK